MRVALEESRAALGQTSPNPAVGAVVVRDGRIVGRGHTLPPGQAHAEVVALRDAGGAARGAEVYVTLEPCSHHGRTPPCTDALIAAGVAAVHYSILDPDPRVAGSGAQALRDAGIRVTEGDGAAEAERLNEGFLKHRRTGLPFVIAKYAASLDGRIAAASGDARWVSGEGARAWAHELRTQVDAILAGSRTVLADDPHLTARPGGELAARQPLRVVLDGAGRVPPGARVFDGAARTLLATTAATPEGWRAAIAGRGAEVAVLPEGVDGHVDLDALLRLLGSRDVLTLLAEGGGELLGALFDQHYVDRLYAVIAPVIIGAAGAPGAVAGRGAAMMREAPRLRELTVDRIGDDILVGGLPVWPASEPPPAPAAG
ncbi:MAG: bifunctional diaminohydroxyphosphoribosylaminopyrimidine deaminase/5-amino-6-(5-phosphoribosylamino)uracil reductase RibD [Dehalococcoidia bacterium]